MPISSSSDWTLPSSSGINSAEGMASRKDWRIGSSKLVCAHAMNRLRSVFEIPPMGFISGSSQKNSGARLFMAKGS